MGLSLGPSWVPMPHPRSNPGPNHTCANTNFKTYTNAQSFACGCCKSTAANAAKEWAKSRLST